MRNRQAAPDLVMLLILLLVVVEGLALYVNVVIAAIVVTVLPIPLPVLLVALIMEKPPRQTCEQRTKVESIPSAFSGDLLMGT